MELFFTENYSPGQEQIALSIEETRHVQKVFRKKTEESIQVTDGKGTLLLTNIVGKQNRQLQLSIQQAKKLAFPKENDIELAISIIRHNRMDWAIEKAAELGVKKIVPLHCHYSTLRNLKFDHLKRIAISAMKQSGQLYLPEICSPISLSDWMDMNVKKLCNRFIAIPSNKGHWKVQSKDSNIKNYQILIGPEGGFHTDELKKAEQCQFQQLNLGSTILRTETAAVVGITFLKSLM